MPSRGFAAAVLTAAIAGFGIVVPATTASAVPGPIAQPSSANVTADVLPTAQIDGVGFSQVVIGNTVIVGGSFSSVRPAGAPPGQQLSARHNLLAYNLTTGVALPWTPTTNGPVKAIAVAPGGKSIYIGGAFTNVNGRIHDRIVKLDVATGRVVLAWNPRTNGTVQSITATATTVYVGGAFYTANGAARARIAAFNATNGALLPWRPNLDGGVNAMVIGPDGKRIIVGGNFTHANKVLAIGMTSLSVQTGGVLPWRANATIHDSGPTSAITSLTTDGHSIFGTGYVYRSGGNLEGSFSANPLTGALNWIEDCHGDTYSSYVTSGVLYVVGHAHFCGNVGGFPETYPATWHRALAFTVGATGTLNPNTTGKYASFAGMRSPSLLNWFPDLEAGAVTGQDQAAWSVTGAGPYVVLAGEFPEINDTPQQGLARFATLPIAPGKQGPMLSGTAFALTPVPTSSSTVAVSWAANWDRDDKYLSYTVIRDGQVVYSTPTPAESEFWNRPTLSWSDDGGTTPLAPGSTHTYQVTATDSTGNTATSSPVSVTLPLS